MKKTLAFWGILTIILAGSYHTVNAQAYKFQQYNKGNGLCHYAVYSIAQDKHGFIWFATGEGLCRYDGFKFSSPSDDLPSANVVTSFKDDKGNLWFGYQDGTIVKYDGVDFSVADTSVNSVVKQIIQTSKGEILAAMQTGGLIRIGKKTDHLTQGFEEFMINAICFVDDERLMMGTHDGLYLYHYGNDGQDMTLITRSEDLSYLPVKYIIPKRNDSGYWVATESDGVFYVTVDENGFSALPLDIPNLENAQVQSVYEDSQGILWVSTHYEGLFRVQLSPNGTILNTNSYNASNGIGSDFVNQVFIDNQQNLWIATFENGVACVTHPAFLFFEGLNLVGNNTTAVFSEDNSEYWLAGIGSIIKISTGPEPKKTVWGRAEGLPPNDKITSLHTDDKGNLWIGTGSNGLYKLAYDTKKISLFYREENSLSNFIQNFVFADDQIWMATGNGVLVIDPKSGSKIYHYNTDSNLPHNNIRDIFKDSQDRIWIATKSNSLVNVKNEHKLYSPDYAETDFSVITEDEHGRIWAGTLGKGVFLFDETRDTTYQFTTETKLKADYCYAITSDKNGRVWIGHRQGLSSINTERLKINTFGIENGIRGDVNLLAMTLNKSGEILIGMTDGALMYNVLTDHSQVLTPMLNLTHVIVNDTSYYNAFKYPIVLSSGKKFKIQFDFVGLQYANPSSVYYQYKLENCDDDWSSLATTTSAIYSRMEYGEWNFWVKACNSESCTEETLLYTIKIRKPFTRTWGFALLVVLAVVGLGYIVVAIRERYHRIQQEYLENELKARTKEVRKQKEEIEVINRDITDSINYAQRIQFSVLPSTGTLQKHCSDAFILYKPRDIVSGDFYWFDYFPNSERLLIVCADATGHGVPGAFMSLIGTTLIKDIAMRPDVVNPADILYRLDENIQSTLNQNTDSEHANDGMDIIVCEINTKTYFTRISSAMRPYVIFCNGKSVPCKSNRMSIGGQHLDGKVFDTHEIQLSKGDTIYMFTDGYTDQFGGPSGKKLKMNRLQNILDDIHNRDMDEQHRVIRENFDLWRGNNPQIDDVLMIGVKI